MLYQNYRFAFGDPAFVAVTHTHPFNGPLSGPVSRYHKHTHTHTHPFNGPFSGTTRVSRYHKVKTYLDFTEARDSGISWATCKICTSLHTDNHTSTSLLSFLQARCPSCGPTNSVKALKAEKLHQNQNEFFCSSSAVNADLFGSMPPVTKMVASSLCSRHGTWQFPCLNHRCTSLLHCLQYKPDTQSLLVMQNTEETENDQDRFGCIMINCHWGKHRTAHTRLLSVGFRSWSRFLAVSMQVMWVINPAAGCHYFLSGLQLPLQPLRRPLPTSLLGEQRHDGCEQST